MGLIKSPSQIGKMAESGRIVSKTMREVSASIVPGKTTLLDLDNLAHRIITSEGGVPSFLGYRNFPNSACISVNDRVVHGIPTPYILKPGDIVSLDFGVQKDNFHADSAWTFGVGTIDPAAQRLLNVTREALYQGIAQAKIGRTIGDIASAIQRYCERAGYGVVRDLVGHGIGESLHEEPHNVPNFGKPGRGIKLAEGMCLCIEPMINQGTARVKTLDDGWTVVTADGKLSAHFEHTVAITRDGPLILTQERPTRLN
ncbi:MAG: type I methionyl aminopeptidase [Armatimonadota bacterium]